MKQVFQIRAKAGGHLITDSNIDNTIYVTDLQALRQLYDQIGEILNHSEDHNSQFTPPAETIPEMLTVGDAIAYAKSKGYDLSPTTINSACIRGSIPGVIKADDSTYARWQIPYSEFIQWFEKWRDKTDRRKAS